MNAEEFRANTLIPNRTQRKEIKETLFGFVKVTPF